MAKSTTAAAGNGRGRLTFSPHFGREVIAQFDGGLMSSDGGGLLLAEVERILYLFDRLAACFTDHRNPNSTVHSVRALLIQRIVGLVLGYEDLNDHALLRSDPIFRMLAGKNLGRGDSALASPATLNRLENSRPDAAAGDRYRRIAADFRMLDDLLIELFLESYANPPDEIFLDLDVTDDPVHGERQEGRFYHGFYGNYCFLPLYVFCDGHLLLCRPGVANRDPGADVPEQISHVVDRIRRAWPDTRIILRGDSGFCRERTMAWCEDEVDLTYVCGIARNRRLQRAIARELQMARLKNRITGKPERFYKDFSYRTLKSWSRPRRVVGKAEHLARGPNPRFVVTNLDAFDTPDFVLYEQDYCPRGEHSENRIKELQLALFADRTSASAFSTNQLRLYFSGFAYVLLSGLRRLGMAAVGLGRLRCDTVRLRFLKVAAQVKVTTRRVWVSLPGACPVRDEFARVLAALRGLPDYSPTPA